MSWWLFLFLDVCSLTELILIKSKYHYAYNAWLVALPNRSASCPINEVALHRAGLLLGWVTACLQVNHLDTARNRLPRSTQPFILPG